MTRKSVPKANHRLAERLDADHRDRVVFVQMWFPYWIPYYVAKLPELLKRRQ